MSRADSIRAAVARQFDDIVDPERILDPATRAEFAAVARFSRYQQMRRKSVAVRQARAAARRQGVAA